MTKRTIRDFEVEQRRLLVRTDFNVPLGDDGSVSDDSRIRAALPTLEYALERHASLVLMTHLGRPKGEPDPNLRLDGVAQRLRELLEGTRVRKCDEVVGDEARRMADELQPGEVLLLENLRFDPREEEADEEFAQKLREFGDLYVNDAFATCHRKHASTYALPQEFPRGSRVAGLLVQRELKALDRLRESPQQPLIVLLGGAKASDKLGVIETLAQRAEHVLIGGAMTYTFMKAQDRSVGTSKVAEDKLDEARRLLEQLGDKLVLPEDHVVAKEAKAGAETKQVEGEIPEGWMGVDIGPKTRARYADAMRGAGTVVWNGPLGIFKEEPFREGTEVVLRAMAESGATTLVGGGDSGAVVQQLGLSERIDHVSTGGGAFLEYLQNGSLPALEVLDEQESEVRA